MINGGRVRRSVLAVVGAGLVALGLGACDPAPPPDGRDLAVDVAAIPRNATLSSPVTFTVGVRNLGTSPAVGARFTYAVQGGITLGSVTPAGGAACPVTSPGVAACDLGDLAPGQAVTLTVTGMAGSTTGPVQHLVVATSAGSEPSPDPSSNGALVTTTVRPVPTNAVDAGLTADANFLGTGSLLANGSPFPAEGITLAESAYCTDKWNGDRLQSAYVGGVCAGSVNQEYFANGYTYVLDVPAARTGPLGVWAWDASYNKTCTGVLSGTTCNGDATPPPDSFLSGSNQPYTEPITISVYAADNTPLDASDNPLLCTRTLTADTPFEKTFLGSPRWHQLCNIPATAPAGAYYLRVRNAGTAAEPKANGTNRFGLVAANLDASTDPAAVLCSRLSDPTCPTWSARTTTPVMFSTQGVSSRFPLHRIPATEAGRLLRLEVWDPGEGVEAIRILRPTGPSSWTPASFTWSSTGGAGGTATSLDVTLGRFNGKLVQITVDLDGYAPDPANDRWLVEYVTGFVTVTDVATWTGYITNAPVPG
jgi:hypothetical protein